MDDTTHARDILTVNDSKEASLDNDTSGIFVDTTSIDRKSFAKQVGYPLSVSYPLRKSKITVSSPYGMRRHPILGGNRFHNGIDIPATLEPVYSMLPGKVLRTGYDSRSGNYVTLQHGAITVSYCHLSKIAINKGSYVYAGQPLGIAGSTGMSTGVHLHLTLKVNGQSYNPITLLRIIENTISKQSG